MMNKKKIINDPVWGFIHIPFDLAYDLISHTYFQRLRRISQMGLSYMVYPGAVHSRFHHSIGCLHLMSEALKNLQSKGVEITEEEIEGACVAILLHDLGHGPFSHVLEKIILPGISHEDAGSFFMQELNREMGGRLDIAMQIFSGTHPKRFLHQLVSGQLDVDRLDYLNRDSFFTGVHEGTVGAERILKMMNVKNGELVLEEKGIYSLEKFILSRRMMYWQVYLHKTSVCAEQMLVHAILRAKKMLEQGEKVGGSSLFLDLQALFSGSNVPKPEKWLPLFAKLDDSDIWYSLKIWSESSDIVLKSLSKGLLSRNLLKSELQNIPFDPQYINEIIKKKALSTGLSLEEIKSGVFVKELNPRTYNPKGDGIQILRKDGSIVDITKVSELLDQHFVIKQDTKYLLCY